MRIGIVGGGPGGLMTAYLIQKYSNIPDRLTILEASDRLGGKIQTPRFETTSATYEAGAAELYDYSHLDEDPLKELITELGLSTTRMEGSTVFLDGQVFTNQDDICEQMSEQAAQALQEFDRRASDAQTPLEFYRSDHTLRTDAELIEKPFQPFLDSIHNERALRYVSVFIHSDLATETKKTNLEYGLQNYLMNNPRYMRLYSIDGGNEQLPQALADRIHGQFLLNHRVTELQRTESKRYRLTSLAEGSSHHHEFDCVILALPNGPLRSLRFPDQRLAEAMRGHLARYDYPAHYLRITILFTEPFWRTVLTDSYCMLDCFGGCCLYDESRRHPGSSCSILGWLIAGDDAEAMSDWDDEHLINAALDSLPESMGSGRAYFREGRVHRWIGAVNAIPGGKSPISLDRRHQPEPIDHPFLYVVGDYLFDSTLNGVLDSADYVAQWVVSRSNEQGVIST